MENNNLYDVYFKGETLEGFQEADVRASLQALFNAPASKIDQMFCGKAVIVKKNVDKTTAIKYQNALKKAGAKPLISAKPQSNSNHFTANQKPASSPAQQTQTQTQTQPDDDLPQKPSLAQRLAELDQEFSQQAAIKAAKAKEAITDKAAAPKSPEQPQVKSQVQAGLNVMPVGADILTSNERTVVTPVNPDTSALSMASVGATLGEKKQEAEPLAPDTDYLSVAETGADINPDKPAELPLPEFDLSNISLAESGERLIEPSPEPLPPDMDLSNMTLADAGAQLADNPEKPEVKAPDVSHIRLSD